MGYVMLSRAQTLDQIVILDGLYTDQNGWKPHQSAIDEMETSKKKAINVHKFEKLELQIMSLNILSLANNLKLKHLNVLLFVSKKLGLNLQIVGMLTKLRNLS